MKMVAQPNFTEDGQATWKGKSVSGKVSIVVNENGEITQAQVLAASPQKAADALLSAAKGFLSWRDEVSLLDRDE
jgi:hypothetical protein